MHKLTKKSIVVAAAVTAVALGGGVAFAYWSTSASSSGSAASSNGATNLAIVQGSTIAGLAPGTSAQTIYGTVTNNASNTAYVNNVIVSIASVTQAAGATGTCDSSDYIVSNGTMPVGKDLAAGAVANFTGATIAFVDKSTNQDGCKGATVNLAYVSN